MRQKRIPVSCFSKEFQTKKLYIFSKSLVCCALDGLEHLTVIYRTFYYPYVVLATSTY